MVRWLFGWRVLERFADGLGGARGGVGAGGEGRGGFCLASRDSLYSSYSCPCRAAVSLRGDEGLGGTLLATASQPMGGLGGAVRLAGVSMALTSKLALVQEAATTISKGSCRRT